MAVGFGAVYIFFQFINLLFKLTYFVYIYTAIIQLIFKPLLHVFTVAGSIRFCLLRVFINLCNTACTVGDKLLPVEAMFCFRLSLLIFYFITAKLILGFRLLLGLKISIKFGFRLLLAR